MPDIMVLLACLSQCIDPTPLRQLGRVIEAMLSMSGRVTMRGLSRWSDRGGSYRTIQRFFNTSLSWCPLQWLLIRHHLLDADDVVVMSGDHVVVTGAHFSAGEGWHSNENAVRFWTPSPRVPKEADTRCYAYTTAYAMMIQLCNAFWTQSQTPPPSPQ